MLAPQSVSNLQETGSGALKAGMVGSGVEGSAIIFKSIKLIILIYVSLINIEEIIK